jgi:two-component system, response regulator, stage 0 sporulation protein F
MPELDIRELKNELTYLGLFDKAKEIYKELGVDSVLSYIKSSHRLLSKVYHPDVNPDNMEKATITQQKLNKVGQLIRTIKDDEIVKLFRSEKPEEDIRKKKILVVEDEFGLQEIFRDIFMMEGYDVRVAVDGVDGYEVYKKFQPDLVFTDVVMPKMSGLELVKKIRETDPDIKVIYISGFFGIKRLKKDLDEEIMRHGCPTLSKPFKTSDMLELVSDYLSR